MADAFPDNAIESTCLSAYTSAVLQQWRRANNQ
jgi:hypothetical protein